MITRRVVFEINNNGILKEEYFRTKFLKRWKLYPPSMIFTENGWGDLLNRVKDFLSREYEVLIYGREYKVTIEIVEEK